MYYVLYAKVYLMFILLILDTLQHILAKNKDFTSVLFVLKGWV